MPADFSKIFSTNGAILQPTDTQYLQGFAFLGAAAPTRGLFNYLFQNIDQKLLALYSGSKLWKSSTSYSVGDVVFSANAASYKLMECTTAGTSGLTEPTWPTAGNTVNDGSAVWTVRDITKFARIDQLPSIAVLSGTVVHGGTVPLPSGYSAAQCKFGVWPMDIGHDNFSGDEMDYFTVSVDPTTRVVSVTVRVNATIYTPPSRATCGYMVIGTK